MSVPTCKYFARGTCRYGDRCRFYHPPGGNVGGQQAYYGGQGDNSRGGVVYNQIQESRLKLNENVRAIEEMVKKDMIEWEKGKIWPFSCYGPTGSKPNLEGFEDISYEELRLATLQNNGVLPNNIPMRVQLWNQARAKWQQTTQENLNAIEQIILGSAKPAENSPFQQTQTSGGFGNSQTPFSGNTFASTGSGFNQGLFNQKPNASIGSFSFSLGNETPKQNQNAMDAGSGSQLGALSSFSFNQGMSQNQLTMNQGLPASTPLLSMGQQGFPSNNQVQQPTLNQGFPMGAQPQQQQAVLGQFSMNTQSQQPAFNPGFPSAPQAQNLLNPGFATGMQTQQPTANPAFNAPTQPQTSANPMSSFSFNINQDTAAPGVTNAFGPGSAFTGGSSQPSFFNAPQNVSAPSQSPFGQLGFNAGGANANMEAYEKNVYSNLSDLTPNEIQAFEAPKFQVDTLPLKAPAKKFCF